ncbi:signal peptidase I [Clostridium sp. KNHs214]|uniref:signal peptidase I n=1 Tax=Clostridium sp. KNHs214 TaxID=1540257 RepID=UPI00069101A9|nr:signal peptidase I [Clostridium sp. KNHs214]
MKKRIKVIVNVFFILIIALLSWVIIGNLLSKGDKSKIPTVFGYRSFIVLSGSMEPKIKPGDVILVKKTHIEELKEGDILTYISEDNFITHRIKKIQGNSLITKGDANNVEDSPIKSSQVYGKYSFRVPYLGYILVGLRKPLVIFIIIAIFIVYVIVEVLKKCFAH